MHEIANKIAVLFIERSKFTTLLHKLNGTTVKKDRVAYMKEVEGRVQGPAKATEALRLMQTLRRCEIAMDFGDLVSFETLDLWVQVLIATLQKV